MALGLLSSRNPSGLDMEVGSQPQGIGLGPGSAGWARINSRIALSKKESNEMRHTCKSGRFAQNIPASAPSLSKLSEHLSVGACGFTVSLMLLFKCIYFLREREKQ